MTVEIISAVGIGSIVTIIANYLIHIRTVKQDSKHTFKETRYKAIILLCYALANYEREQTTLVIQRPDINSIDRLKNEIQAEFINMSLFASDNVIIATKDFLAKPNQDNLNVLALAMRKDLYGIRTKLKVNHFNV